MKLKGCQNGYEISYSENPSTDFITMFRDNGQTLNARHHISIIDDITDEQKIMATQDIKEASLAFERTRKGFIDAFQSIMRFIFEEYDLPTRNGIDFGCGATGAMVEQLIAPVIDKNSWAQVDINPRAVEENRKRHPSSVIFPGSYLDTGSLGLKGNMNMVTGLSSLDATQFVPEAIEEIRKALKVGGFLLHIQDVRPGLGSGLREMLNMGYEPPYEVETLHDGSIISYVTPHGEVLSAVELFRRNLRRAIDQNEGMEIIMDKWVTARKDLSSQLGDHYFMNIRAASTNPTKEASVVATLAKRVK